MGFFYCFGYVQIKDAYTELERYILSQAEWLLQVTKKALHCRKIKKVKNKKKGNL